MSGLEVIFGTASLGNGVAGMPLATEEGMIQAFDVLKKHGVKKLDTAQIYGNSEATLGKLKAGTDQGFIIDTKWVGGWTGQPGASTKEKIIDSANESLKKLGQKKVDVFYMHSPDTKTPLADTLAGINQVYQSGGFERFGLSNYTPEQVQEVYDLCKKEGYVLPTVYQGNYSAVARKQEEFLFPLLRKLGIAFYAYSPIAGGFLTKTRAQVERREGRFNPERAHGIYHTLYSKPKFLDALEDWEEIASEEGVSRAELAYRWVAFHSSLKKENGDGVIIGASRIEQLEQTLKSLEAGKLSAKAVEKIQGVWDKVKDEAGVDNFQALFGS